MSRKKINGAPKTVAQRVVVRPHKTSFMADVNGVFRFCTTKGPMGITEWRNFKLVNHVGKQHHFTRPQFRQWVVEFVENEERGHAGICDSPEGVDGEVRVTMQQRKCGLPIEVIQRFLVDPFR
jgi:hypothetical protein